MSVSALINGTGILVYSLCNECAPTIIIRDGKYVSKFCAKCDRRTFGMKYPCHVEKFPTEFYVVPCSVLGRGSVVTVVLGGCCKPSLSMNNEELTFNFCTDCQKRTISAKYPKQITNAV
ncbi:hypothetical protein CAEBREN_25032 [Caenorhabditis brenneri]|uniref:Uncharacterized protein n=1 Tax=Caenorhabditis brenneri TaxID=135651 RepID=G0P1W4_CAEBE|nr:hypothetical protein CAEBREN_25032 [Caenorhabditis brenneri]